MLLIYFDEQRVVAESLGITKQAVNHWFKGRLLIPLHHARRLEKMTQGRVSIKELRPDF